MSFYLDWNVFRRWVGFWRGLSNILVFIPNRQELYSIMISSCSFAACFLRQCIGITIDYCKTVV